MFERFASCNGNDSVNIKKVNYCDLSGWAREATRDGTASKK